VQWPASTTGLARRVSPGQWVAVETGLGDMHATALDPFAGVDPRHSAVRLHGGCGLRRCGRAGRCER
jgi:hypothetical protein